MKKAIIAIGVVLALIVACAVGVSNSTNSADIGYVQGTVLDQTREPAVNVTITVKNSKTNQVLGVNATNEQGKYNVTVFADLPTHVDIYYTKGQYKREEFGLLVPRNGWVSRDLWMYMTLPKQKAHSELLHTTIPAALRFPVLKFPSKMLGQVKS